MNISAATINNFLIEEELAFPYYKLKEILEKEDISVIQNEQILIQGKYFNGKSKFRLQKIFNKLILADLLHFRKAVERDVNILFDWANDDEVRQASFNTEKITFEDHNNWFHKKINDPKSLICIAQVKNIPAGMIRFDIKPSETSISYLLDKKFRGKSLGSAMLTKGIAFFKSNYNGIYPTITGYIKTSNTASIKAFLKAGFVQIQDENTSLEDSGKYLLKAH
ncbi:MAG: N-acetyltransferase [Sphingobacteriales bacterium]|nr:MAG: N-acetyltransferase [Sphingobacteriales bacterium]